jgi:benzoate/toluate 1,2-dioxygenase beta subunit
MSTISLTDVEAFLYRECRLLDDEQWDEWLTCYHPDAPFWMPSWDDEDKLITDPQREISLIYYPNRRGLEDRVFRIKTERSSATMPDTRGSGERGGRRVHGAFQLAHAKSSLQDELQLLRHVAVRNRL